MLKRVLHQDKGLLVAATGGLVGIAIGIGISLLALAAPTLPNAIIFDLVVVLFFGVAPFLLARWADKYLVLYGLGLFVVNLFILHMFLPATLLLLVGALMRFFRRVK